MPCGITQCYLPPDRGNISDADNRCDKLALTVAVTADTDRRRDTGPRLVPTLANSRSRRLIIILHLVVCLWDKKD